MTEAEEDIPYLSAETFSALQEFYNEQLEKETKLNVLNRTGDSKSIAIDEDWQLSQFWYDENTINNLVKGSLNSVTIPTKIALVSCPSLYPKMKQSASDSEITLFEYDQRFAIYGPDFVFYDYKSPLDIPRYLANYYDLVIADPPFLSEECITKTALTLKFLTKHKIVLCTGEVMSELADKLLHLRKCLFKPGHVNNLANEFSCYANFDFDSCLCINK